MRGSVRVGGRCDEDVALFSGAEGDVPMFSDYTCFYLTQAPHSVKC